MTSTPPPLPISLLPALPANAALLLDLDGTLLDIAPTPDAVVVPSDLPRSLLGLRKLLGDAVAVITGRPVEQIDALLPGIPYAVAGEHGGAIRHSPNRALERADLPTPPAEWRAQAERVAAGYPGVLIEEKARGFVLHYRAMPEIGPVLRQAMLSIMADHQLTPSDNPFELMRAHMAWELKPSGADKGHAVRRIMAQAPFAGRIPIYVGDDVTDEDGMRVARAAGGQGYRVQDVFGDPAGVRAWLARLAEGRRP